MDRPCTLVVDADTQFLKTVREDAGIQMVPPVFAHTGKDALDLLKQPGQQFMAIFINPNMTNPGGIKLISEIHRHSPGSPVYILYDQNLPFTERELSRMAISGCLAKPLSYRMMMEVVSSSSFGEMEPYLYKNPLTSEEVLQEARDAGFVPVPARTFLADARTFFDVYVRVRKGKYLKVLNAKDKFTPERLKKYLAKDLDHFYLKRSNHEACLTYCDYLAKRLLESDGVSDEVKISQISNKGDAILEKIKERGIDEIMVEYGLEYVNDTMSIIKHIDISDRKLVHQYLKDVNHHEHAVRTSFVAGLLTIPLKMEAKFAVKVVGLAALLHDIGLYELGVEDSELDLEGLEPTKRSLIESHPLVGAEILRKLENVDEAVCQAVAQHHERRDKSGYPRQISGSAITRVAEIVGLAEEFVTHFDRSIQDPKYSFKDNMEKVFPGFSPDVVDAFKEVFMPRIKKKNAA